MIAITGLRSGTSLMMQTLKLLGFPIVGMKYHKHFSHKELNPRGYYDMPIEYTINGMNSYRHKGQAIKLYGAQLAKTDPKYVSKLIICEREYEPCIKSVQRLMELDVDITGLDPSPEHARLLHGVNIDLIERSAKHIENIRVKFEDMLSAPDSTIKKVCKFLNIETAIDKAVENVVR